MTTNTAVKTSEWVERARALAPVVEQWRDAGEQERHVPRPLFEASATPVSSGCRCPKRWAAPRSMKRPSCRRSRSSRARTAPSVGT